LILKREFSVIRGTDACWGAQQFIPSTFADLLKESFPKLRVFGFDLISLTSKFDWA
jgi:hypothetical protein